MATVAKLSEPQIELRWRMIKHYNEIHDFTMACMDRGWSKEKVCSCLGISEEAEEIINALYFNGSFESSFTICPSDEEDDDLFDRSLIDC